MRGVCAILSEMKMSGLLQRVAQLGSDRGKYVVDAVKTPVERVLDIGCAYGWTIGDFSSKAKELYGVDIDEHALQMAREHYPHAKFFHQTGAKLPFDDDMFDVVILSEVIEHVGDENKQGVIDEAYRVLKRGGLFIVTAPYAGIFSWMDPLDFKRRFPQLYRLYMKKSGYNPSTPIEIGHKHVSMQEIRRLFARRFKILDVRYCGVLTPLLLWATAIGERLHLISAHNELRLNQFRAWESGVPVPRFLAFNLRLTARKN